MSNHREDFPIVQMLLQALPVERLCYNSSWVIQMTSDDLKWPQMTSNGPLTSKDLVQFGSNKPFLNRLIFSEVVWNLLFSLDWIPSNVFNHFWHEFRKLKQSFYRQIVTQKGVKMKLDGPKGHKMDGQNKILNFIRIMALSTNAK